MEQIVTVTANPAVDRSAVVDQVRIDVKLRMHSVRRDAGGGGINVSRGDILMPHPPESPGSSALSPGGARWSRRYAGESPRARPP